jgi:hypothetical protein
LRSDTRVTSIDPPTLDDAWTASLIFYPAAEDEDLTRSELLQAAHFHGVRFSHPLRFWIHVPIKNQETYSATDEVPSEDYLVYWNAETILVAWPHPAEKWVGIAGGQIVADILTTAASRVDCDIYIQPCEPTCRNLFLHTDIRVIPDPNGKQVSGRQAGVFTYVVTIPAEDTCEAVSDALWDEYSRAVERFGRAKSLAQRVLDLDRTVQRDLETLAELHHNRAAAANASIWQRTKAVWTFRGWRRQSRDLLAALWRTLGQLEQARRGWAAARFTYEQSATEAKLTDFFARDEAADFRAVESLDASLAESSIEYAAGRLDTSAVIMATVGGALAGTLAGAVVSLI